MSDAARQLLLLLLLLMLMLKLVLLLVLLLCQHPAILATAVADASFRACMLPSCSVC